MRYLDPGVHRVGATCGRRSQFAQVLASDVDRDLVTTKPTQTWTKSLLGITCSASQNWNVKSTVCFISTLFPLPEELQVFNISFPILLCVGWVPEIVLPRLNSQVWLLSPPFHHPENDKWMHLPMPLCTAAVCAHSASASVQKTEITMLKVD